MASKLTALTSKGLNRFMTLSAMRHCLLLERCCYQGEITITTRDGNLK